LPIIRGFIKPRLDIYRKRIGSSDYRNASGIMRKILVKTVNDDIKQLLPKIKVPTLLLWGIKMMQRRLKQERLCIKISVVRS